MDPGFGPRVAFWTVRQLSVYRSSRDFQRSDVVHQIDSMDAREDVLLFTPFVRVGAIKSQAGGSGATKHRPFPWKRTRTPAVPFFHSLTSQSVCGGWYGDRVAPGGSSRLEYSDRQLSRHMIRFKQKILKIMVLPCCSVLQPVSTLQLVNPHYFACV